jgi:peptidoglycan hydrolase-like protein with peptidoglycan-binding domain
MMNKSFIITLFLFVVITIISVIGSYTLPAHHTLGQPAGETPSTGSESAPTPVITSKCDPKSETVLYGDKGPKVIEIQTYLTQLGYGDLLGKHGPKQIGIDGIFEKDTRNTVIKFQEDKHLKKIDGKVGPETWFALCNLINTTPPPAPSLGSQPVQGVAIPAQYQKILDKLDQLASIADNDIAVFGSPNFDGAVRLFRNHLASQLGTIDFSRPNVIPPSALAITLQALKLWAEDDGKTWGASDDTADFVSSAGCYATVKSHENKCNIYVTDVIYRATGVTFKDIPEKVSKPPNMNPHIKHKESPQETGKYIPFRARDWGNPSTKIPHFQVTSNPKMGDIWGTVYPHTFTQDSGHVGIYLGEYDGIKIYVSARSDADGVYGIGPIQHEYGVQIKELIPPKDGVPNGGTYREYSP